MAVRKRTRKVAKPPKTRTAVRTWAAKRATSPRRPQPKTASRAGPAERTRPTAPPLSLAPSPRPARTPSAIGCTAQHLDFTSHALDDLRRFYIETLGFSDSTYDERFHYLRVVTAAGASLGFMPPMPGPPEQWRPPREPALYFMVDDVDSACDTLKARGVALQQEPTDMPWKHRVAVLKDPEGRLIMLAQALEP